MSYKNPIIDQHNPLYCPNVSPTTYLATLRQSLSKPSVLHNDDSLFSFARNLDYSFTDEDSYHDEDVCRVHGNTIKNSSSPDALPPYSPPRWERRFLPPYMPNERQKYTKPNPVIKRKRSSNSVTTFSDMEAPTKRERSSESIHDSSFDLSKEGERLFFSRYLDVSPPVVVKQEHVDRSIVVVDGHHDQSQLLERIRVLEGTYFGQQIMLIDISITSFLSWLFNVQIIFARAYRRVVRT